MRVTETIGKDKFSLWLEVFKLSGGRFMSNPIEFDHAVLVSYEFTDMSKASQFRESFTSLTTPIVETRRSKLKTIKKRLSRLFKPLTQG